MIKKTAITIAITMLCAASAARADFISLTPGGFAAGGPQLGLLHGFTMIDRISAGGETGGQWENGGTYLTDLGYDGGPYNYFFLLWDGIEEPLSFRRIYVEGITQDGVRWANIFAVRRNGLFGVGTVDGQSIITSMSIWGTVGVPDTGTTLMLLAGSIACLAIARRRFA
jgi:hypothetical protein